ncbi:2-oxoacid:acceptor oxidoreductase subunit alpha [Desulfobacter sp. UBA2225]|uniref:2-oxoacid:acceptor oxidoreductase subunit alpha n=1 Tax=Desulfobacter sp. UBA2225 TaxID=1961413 RepID=UPI00257F6C74|nr:2-oxoacid:acceptor oxidoreductase subunit alpha [Desulfobacter sp. UBA2225]
MTTHTNIDMTLKIGGAAGQGIQTIGNLLASASRDAGFYIMAINDFESRVRGGHSFFQMRISDKPVYAPHHRIDLLIALNRETWDLHKDQLQDDGIAILEVPLDSPSKQVFEVEFSTLAKEIGSSLYSNTVAAAVGLSILGASFDKIADLLSWQFAGKKEDIIQKNIKAARLGYDAVKDIQFSRQPFLKTSDPKGQIMEGSRAIALGAIASDCRVAAFYPMSPATSIMQHLAGWTNRLPLVVEQAEDEIAAVNMVIGASFAGARAMTATSGGGFCLMTEGLGLSATTETPIVIIDAQRPGPATGLPTRTAQGDLLFAIHASQDDFPRFVFAPGSLLEAFEITQKAFALSEKYQVPAIILVDQYMADSIFILEHSFTFPKKVERFIVGDKDLKDPKNYNRYELTPSGVSPRALPCTGAARVVVSSDEHREDGHITEDIDNRNAMVNKRKSKLPDMIREMSAPQALFPEAKTVLLGWGSTSGSIKESVEFLRNEGIDVGCLLFTDLWPFPTAIVESHLKDPVKTIITVEQNSGAQFGHLLKEQTGISYTHAILKYDGRPFYPIEIMAAVKEKEKH